jgi:hypothetical protein
VITWQILGAYGANRDDLERLIKEHEPRFDKKVVVRFGHPNVHHDNCPPFFIMVDDERQEVALYVRGLNLLHKSDYVALMSKRKHELVRLRCSRTPFIQLFQGQS